MAKEFSDVEFDDMIVDACAMQLVKDPTKLDVIVIDQAEKVPTEN